jgi:multimeric flavodoxin WrbA
MKILALIGSKNLNGLTASSVNAICDGIIEGGGEVEKIFLPDLKIERCLQCGTRGWGICDTEGKCIIADDFASLTEKISSADIIIFATPVYFSELSESMKAFIDRLRRTCINDDAHPQYKEKQVLGICMAGGSGNGSIACCLTLETALLRCGFDVVDMIPVKKQNIDVKLEILKKTGKWLTKR